MNEEFTETGDAPERGIARALGRAFQVVGGIVSLALLAGIVAWGYQLVMRDVSGVPVVQALDGPMRVAPEAPGGEIAPNTGLAVNRVAEDGGAAPPEDRVVLAPPPPELAPEDTPLGVVDTSAAFAPRPADAEPPGEVESRTERLDAAAILELADELARDAEPLSPLEPVESAAPEPVLVSATARAVGRSDRPSLRPGARLVASGSSPQTTAAVTAPREVDPASITPGTRLVQLGAYDSRETALAEWVRISSRFAAYFEGKGRVVQQATSGGRSFFRLRVVGFEDLSEARRFCATLVAENTDCIPVVTR